MSAAGRAAIAAAARARWAKVKGTAPSAKPAQKTKKKLSAQGIANIRAGVAKRMAAQGKAVQKPKQKRKMTAAWKKALERAWAARRAKGKAAKSK
jgi:surface antigen